MIRPFDRQVASRRLQSSNRHVKEGQQRVDALLALLAKLEREGHDTKHGQMLLRVFEETLALQVRSEIG
jgi:hypothetical protein